MNDVMGIIYTIEGRFHAARADCISARSPPFPSRAVIALSILRFRIMVNSGVRNVGVIAQRNYHSLMDHLGSGKEWDLHTRNNGLFILPPFLTSDNGGEYSGVVEALRSEFRLSAPFASRST